jgi:hypothetical protein
MNSQSPIAKLIPEASRYWLLAIGYGEAPGFTNPILRPAVLPGAEVFGGDLQQRGAGLAERRLNFPGRLCFSRRSAAGPE